MFKDMIPPRVPMVFGVFFLSLFLWLAALSVLMHTASPPELHAFRFLAGVLAIGAAVIDWRTLRLPASLTLSAAGVAICGEGLFGVGWLQPIVGAGAGFSVLKLAQIFCRLRHKKDCLGSGDALLMLSLGALAGVEGLPWSLGLATTLAYFSIKLLRTEKLPFGPFLTAAFLVVALAQWRFHLFALTDL